MTLFCGPIKILNDANKNIAQVVRASSNPVHKVMFVSDYVERIIQQHASNLLNNGLRR